VTNDIQPKALTQVGEMIAKVIDFEQSKNQLRAAVAADISPDLDEMKRKHSGMASMLEGVATVLVHEVPEWAREHIPMCIFFPQVGFLTMVTLDQHTGKGNYEGEGLDDEWEHIFSAEGHAYYKTRQMKVLDDSHGDIHAMIAGMVCRRMWPTKLIRPQTWKLR
jgi:DNA mismatch repair protein MSH5